MKKSTVNEKNREKEGKNKNAFNTVIYQKKEFPTRQGPKKLK